MLYFNSVCALFLTFYPQYKMGRFVVSFDQADSCFFVLIIILTFCPQDKKTPGRLVVRFEDGDERSVHEDDLIVCELLPVGTNVLVQREGDWSEPARILSHWKRAEVKGYEVEFVDHSQGK